jgi:hypothetical protein
MAKLPRFKWLRSGQWEQPIQHGYLLACCDCGLVHRFDFRVVNGEVEYRVFHARKATAELRKENRYPFKMAKKAKR